MNQAVAKYQYKKPFSIRVSTETMEERLPHTHTPISPQSEDKLVAIHRPSVITQTSGLSYETTDIIGYRTGENTKTENPVELVHFYEDDQSSSGWSHVGYAIPGISSKHLIQKINAFYENGLIYALVEYQAESAALSNPNSVKVLYAKIEGSRPVWQEWKSGGTAGNLLNEVRQLCVHRRRDATHVIYGISHGYDHPQFFMLFPEEKNLERTKDGNEISFKAVRDSGGAVPGGKENQSGHVYQITEPKPEEPLGSSVAFELMRLTNGGIEFHHVFIEKVTRGPTRYKFRFERDRYANLQSPGLDLKDARIQVVPARDGETVIVRTSDNRIGFIEDFQTDKARFVSLMTKTGPEKINRLATTTRGNVEDPHFSTMLFATDSENLLWMRSGVDAQNSTHWVLLGDEAAELACPKVTHTGGEVFLVASGAKLLSHKVKEAYGEAEKSAWTTQSIAASSIDPANGSEEAKASAHVFNIDVIDADGLHLVGQEVTVTSDAWVNLYIDGVSYRTGPRLPLKLKSDNVTGHIRAIIRTPGVSAPAIQVSLPDDEKTAVKTIHPNNRIPQRLGGNVKGYDVARAVVDGLDGVEERHKKLIRKVIKNYGESSEKCFRNGKPKNKLKGAYRLSFHNKGSFNEETNISNIEKSFSNDNLERNNIFHIGDIFNLIGNALHKVDDVLVGIYDESVRLAVNISGKIYHFVTKAFDEVLGSLEAFGDMLTAVFRAMGHLIEDIGKKILAAVSFLLNGEHIFAANDAAQAEIKGMLRMVSKAVDADAERLDTTFQEGIKKVDDFLDNLIKKSGGYKNLAKGAEHNDIEVNGVTIRSPAAVANENRAGANVMGSAISQYTKGSDQSFIVSDSSVSLIEELIEKIRNKYSDDLGVELDSLKKIIIDGGVFDKIKDDPFILFKLMKSIMIFFVNSAKEMFLFIVKMISGLLSDLLNFLDKEIGIPFLTSMVQLWSGDPSRKFRFLDVLTLPGAFLGTAVWKILTGRVLISKKQSETFVAWVGKPDGPIDLWSAIDNDDINNKCVESSNSSVKNGKFPTEPAICISVLKCLRMAGNIANIVIFSLLSRSAKLLEMWKIPVFTLLSVVNFLVEAIQQIVVLCSTLIQWIFEKQYEMFFPSGDEMKKGSESWVFRQVMIELVIGCVAVGVISGVIVLPVYLSLGVGALPLREFVLLLVGVAILIYLSAEIVIAAVDLKKPAEKVWEILTYAYRFAGAGSIMGGRFMAILAFFYPEEEPIGKSLLSVVSVSLMGMGDIFNETGIFVQELKILL